MIHLPVAGRELRAIARRRSTYWARFSVALQCILLVTLIWLVMSNENAAQKMIGRASFIALSVVAFLYCLLSGVLLTSDSLSEEKREGTLGLLFLTDLKGYDVVAGKLVGTSVAGVYAIMALFPILALPILLGGVAGKEFWRVVLVLTNTLFFSLSAGILASTLCQRARMSLLVSLGLVLALTALLPAVGFASILKYEQTKRLAGMNFSNPLDDYGFLMRFLLFLPSPGFAMASAFDEVSVFTKHLFWYSSAVTQGLAWIFLLLAARILPLAWQEKPVASSKGWNWRSGWHRLLWGSAGWRQDFRRRLLAINPYYWLAGRERFGPWKVWTFLGISLALWLLAWRWHDRDWANQETYFFSAFTLGGVLKIWIGNEASRRLAADRRSGALELLLVTPLPVRQIIAGQWQALRHQFLWPLISVLVVDAFFFVNLDAGWSSVYSEQRTMFLTGMGFLVVDMATLGWLGMWIGLRSRRYLRDVLSRIILVLLLHWVLFGVIMAAFNTIPWVFRLRYPKLASWQPSFSLCLAIWIACGLVVNLSFFAWAYHGLTRNFRRAAMAAGDKLA